jgi:hypothetical protein
MRLVIADGRVGGADGVVARHGRVTWPWRSPQATRRALTARVRARYPQSDRQNRVREIAYRRLLARLFYAQPDRRVVKGGAALAEAAPSAIVTMIKACRGSARSTGS